LVNIGHFQVKIHAGNSRNIHRKRKQFRIKVVEESITKRFMPNVLSSLFPLFRQKFDLHAVSVNPPRINF
jgi:hypothetical protein